MERTAGDGSAAAPYESLAELRLQHDLLLGALDRRAGEDLSREAESAAVLHEERSIRELVARGAALGALLDDPRERSAGQVLVEYWTTALQRAGANAPPVRLAPFDAEALPELPDAACPYVGLEPFRSPRNFFGRDGDAGRLVEQIRALPLVVVSGASGSGKSSLVMGGALPRLAEGGAALRVLPPFTPGTYPLRALCAALGGAGVGPLDPAMLRRDPGGLAAALEAVGPPALLTVDQFEEVFTLAPDEGPALAAALATLLGGGRGHRVVLTIREEFKARMNALAALEPWLKPAYYDIQPLSIEELRAAVEAPAAAVNLRIPPAIVEDLVQRVKGQRAALPLLQFTLQALWKARRRNRITRDAYEAVGDPLVALARFADAFYEGLLPEHKAEVQRILLELVLVDDLLEVYRRPVRRSRLLEAGRASTSEVLARLAEVGVGFVSVSPGDGDAIVELKHEALVRNWPLLVGWIEQKRLERRRRLALAESARRWRESGEPPEALLTAWQLQELAALPGLEGVEAALVTASRAGLERESQAEKVRIRLAERRRMTTILLAAALALGSVLGAAGLVAYRDLRKKTHELDARAVELSAMKLDLEQQKASLEARNMAYQEALAAPARLLVDARDQLAQAQELAARLGGIGVRVMATEVAPAAASEVRYFRSPDREQAERIVALLAAYPGARPRAVLAEAGGKGDPAERFRIALGRDARVRPGTATEAPPPDATREHFVVLGNDVDCGTAADTYFRARQGLARELGGAFDPSSLRLVAGTDRGRDFFVVVYGRGLSKGAADELAARLRGQPDLRPDLYAARAVTFREQRGCELRDAARTRLATLAAAYVDYRTRTPAGPERTAGMESLFQAMRGAATVAALDGPAIAALYASARSREGARLAALAAVRESPGVEHLPLVAESLRNPSPWSAFEQYQALGALEALGPLLPASGREQARLALQEAWDANVAHLREDPSRGPRVSALLRELDPQRR